MGLHVAVLALVVTGVPDFLYPTKETQQIIPVDVVQIADKTTPKPVEKKAEEKPKPKPKPPEPPQREPPKPKPKPSDVPPPPDEIADLPKPRPKAERLKQPEPKLAEVPVNVKPRAKPKPPSRFDPSRIAALLDKSQKDTAPSQPQEQSIDTRRLTISLQDAIRKQVQPCWLVPAGAPDAEDLVVRLHIALNPDGTLNGPPQILDQGKIGRSDYYRVAAESARRAVQKCSPLKLPVDSYDIWRDINLTFDPKQMITG
ncbi:MAG TPA: cell envelope integrity protein TolA [Alphaproteobacteria bacterium]|nr:cell envelope integrity protein TolA [Alphaproteobacteria bacterium]